MDLPLESMSVPEKLMPVETIWDSICKSPDDVPIPDWHKQELENRIKRLESGDAQLLDWEDVKKRLNKLGQMKIKISSDAKMILLTCLVL